MPGPVGIQEESISTSFLINVVRFSPVNCCSVQRQFTYEIFKSEWHVQGTQAWQHCESFAPCSAPPNPFSPASSVRQVWTHLIRSEQQRVSVLVLVSLHPFKEARRIVQHRRRGIQVQRSVRLDLGGCPSSLRVPRDAQHVVREGATEREGRGFRDRLGGGRELNLEERGLQSEEGGQLQFAISVQHLRSGRLSSHSGHLIDSSHSYPANQRLPSLQIHPIQPTQPIPAMLQACHHYTTPHSLPLILSQASRRHDPLFSALPPVSLTSISALPVPCPFIISTWSPTVPSAEPVDVATAGTDRWREREKERARTEGMDVRARTAGRTETVGVLMAARRGIRMGIVE
jgi:hypothetical protein